MTGPAPAPPPGPPGPTGPGRSTTTAKPRTGPGKNTALDGYTSRPFSVTGGTYGYEPARIPTTTDPAAPAK